MEETRMEEVREDEIRAEKFKAKRKKYSLKLQKTIATMWIAVGLAVAAFCGVRLFSLLLNASDYDVDIDDWLQDQKYGDSETLAWHLTYDTNDVIAYMGLQQVLEDNGLLNLSRPALVVQQEDGTIVTYTMDDLIDLAEQCGSYVYDRLDNTDDIAYYYDQVSAPLIETIQKTNVRILWSLMDHEDASVDLGADVWAVRQKRIEEAIAQAKEEDTAAENSDVWESLYLPVTRFSDVYLQNYYQYRRQFEQAGNFVYTITLTQGNQVVKYQDYYTELNQKSLHEEDAWDMSYFYDSSTRRIVTDMPGAVRDFPIQNLQRWSYRNYDTVTVRFGIDVDRLDICEDEYTRQASIYKTHRNRVLRLTITMGGCALLVLAGMIWMVSLCGRQDNDESIHLNLYDKIPTELGAAGILLLGMGMYIILELAVDSIPWGRYSTIASDVQKWMLGGTTTALLILAYLMLWWGFYGLIRRLKAHTFLKNSLCAILIRWCLKPLKWCARSVKRAWNDVMNYGDVAGKTAVVYTVYLGINLILCIFFFNTYWAIYLLLLLAFNGLVGISLVKKAAQRKCIRQGVTQLAGGKLDHKLSLDAVTGEERKLAQEINQIGGGLKAAVEESLKNERMKTELITNVSHDIKTPLTSIINYVDLLKREHIQDPKIQGYIQVLDQKSQRLKTLTEDLVEASKASSGTLQMTKEKIDFIELINQTTGEFSDRFAAGNLHLVTNIQETPAYIMADGRYVWRILENLYRNAEKYSMPGTRVYVEVFEKIGRVFFVMKNVSNAPLNIKAEELTERFIRGDVSRTTEGSGLGLSIAKDMTELMDGTFRVYLDGDLFRVTVSFAVIREEKPDLKAMEESIRHRMAEEEKKVRIETADVVGESGFAQNVPMFEKDGAEKEKLPKLSLTRFSLPKRKKKSEHDKE